MAGKQKPGGIGENGSGGMRFFHQSLCEKNEGVGLNCDQLINLAITKECRQVFSLCSREAFGYKCTHPDFPVTTFQVVEKNFLVTQEDKAPFHSEVVQPSPPPPCVAQETVVAAAMMTQENTSINQALCKSMKNSNPSPNNNILINFYNSGRNLGVDSSELCALGLVVENEDPLPENMTNVGTMNCAAKAVGNWIKPTTCICAQEKCCNMNGKLSSMIWEILAKADELEIFKVRFD